MKFHFFRFFFIVLSFTLFGQNFAVEFNPSTIVLEFPTPNYHLEEFFFSAPYSKEKIDEKVDEMATFILSSMLFGCDFVFVPNSYLNQVQQEFNFVSRGNIQKERIQIQTQTRTSETTTTLLHYPVSPYEHKKRAFWDNSKDFDSIGKASVSLRTGEKAQEKALFLAIKEAIINIYKKDLLGKPRMIEGSFIFIEAPTFAIESGEWVAKTKLRLHTREVVDYYR